jgi:hypothetical protein
MGFMDDKWAETDRRLRAQIEVQLAPGEALLGAVHANQAKTFSAQQFAVGITPDRLVVVPVNRKLEASGEVRSITRADVLASSVWGWGGGMKEWLSMTGDQQIRIETPNEKFKWAILGGNMFENALAGDEQLAGLSALIEFIMSTKK